MKFFIITPTKKTIPWLKKNNIDINALQYAVSMTFADIFPSSRFTRVNLILQVDHIRDSSTYVFGTNKIYICSDPYYLVKNKKQKIFVIFLHFLHEFRHWMQSEILGVKDRDIKYTEEDIVKNSKKYWNNKYEIDARNFEKKYVRKFMRYYVEFKRAFQQ
jgi:hypothetical protein